VDCAADALHRADQAVLWFGGHQHRAALRDRGEVDGVAVDAQRVSCNGDLRARATELRDQRQDHVMVRLLPRACPCAVTATRLLLLSRTEKVIAVAEMLTRRTRYATSPTGRIPSVARACRRASPPGPCRDRTRAPAIRGA
jgi:hypothetical protein